MFVLTLVILLFKTVVQDYLYKVLFLVRFVLFIFLVIIIKKLHKIIFQNHYQNFNLMKNLQNIRLLSNEIS